jgi:protein TonB
MAISLVLHTGLALAFPKFEHRSVQVKREQVVIEIQDLPETRQIKRPPPRPAVPIETESVDVPDDVTIETTDLEFDDILVDLPPPPPPGTWDKDEEEIEILEFWAVEQAPKMVKQVVPEYPELARRAELEGVIFIEFVVGVDGRVHNAKVIKGPEIFRQPALESLLQCVFEPAIQNDKKVAVRMSKPIRFRLKKFH